MERFDEKLDRVLAEPIELAEYDPAWPGVFEREATRFCGFFPEGETVRIEHVGSTAVPGLLAKPIIDVLVFMNDPSLAERLAPTLEEAGYDYFCRPMIGDSGPCYPFFIARDESGRRVAHIHVAHAGRDADEYAWTDRLLFRDRLRRMPLVAHKYEALKRELVQRHGHDREAYTRAKTAFIVEQTALERAELSGYADVSVEASRISRWMDAYLKAWSTDDTADIAALFEPEARYFTSPGQPPHEGIDAIVAMWVERANSRLVWEFDYEIIATEGAVCVVRGVTTYPDGLDGTGEEVFDNLWLITLAESGRASEFIEFWMLREQD